METSRGAYNFCYTVLEYLLNLRYHEWHYHLLTQFFVNDDNLTEDSSFQPSI